MIVVLDREEGDGPIAIVFREAHRTRLLSWFAVEDWFRQVTFYVKDGREVERVVL